MRTLSLSYDNLTTFVLTSVLSLCLPVKIAGDSFGFKPHLHQLTLGSTLLRPCKVENLGGAIARDIYAEFDGR